MRRLSIISLLVLMLIPSLTGCSLVNVDKNENSYLTTPWDVLPVESSESDEGSN